MMDSSGGQVLTIMFGAVALAAGFAAIGLAMARRRLRDIPLLSFGALALLWGLGVLAGMPPLQAAIGGPAVAWNYVQAFTGYLTLVPLAGYLVGRFGAGRKKVYLWSFRAALFAALVGIFADVVLSKPFSALPDGWTFGLPWQVPILVLLWPIGYYALRQSFAGAMGKFVRENEMESARLVNFTIVPKEITTAQNLRIAQRYVPAQMMKGNFSDIVSVGDTRVCILIGDVAGRGVGAAAVATILKAIFAAQVNTMTDPGAVLTGMNTILGERTEKKSASAACLMIDSLGGALAYAHAGHTPLIIWRQRGKKIEDVAGSGVTLGSVPDEKYSTSFVTLGTGDRLVLYSKGAIEMLDRRGALYGEKRLRDLVRANERLAADPCAEAIMQDMLAWAGMNSGGDLNDDVTLIVVDMLSKDQSVAPV